MFNSSFCGLFLEGEGLLFCVGCYVRSLLLLVPISPWIILSLVVAVFEIVNEVLTLPSSCRCMCLELSNLLCRP